jgi:hypothetical protein
VFVTHLSNLSTFYRRRGNASRSPCFGADLAPYLIPDRPQQRTIFPFCSVTAWVALRVSTTKGAWRPMLA